MDLKLPNNWSAFLKEETEKPYYNLLIKKVETEYKKHTCFPPKHEIFNALKLCNFDNLKIVIIGQDPYHGKNQANGLCFSVNDNIKIPPSLQNIFKELQNDIGKKIPNTGNLTHWAKQGILLLNATLTVRESQANSHQKYHWDKFTNAIIKKISLEKEHIVFLLWGGFAKKKSNLIGSKHLVLTSGHPSPLSANRGFWFGNNHFSKANTYLTSKNIDKIDW